MSSQSITVYSCEGDRKPKDYIKNNMKTRPICGIYELAGTITALSKYIYDETSISDYLKDNSYNNLINPTLIAMNALGIRNDEFCKQNVRDALLNRTEDENVKFSNLYVSDFYVDELNEYFTRQLNTISNYREDDDDDFEIDSDDCDNETEMEFKYAED